MLGMLEDAPARQPDDWFGRVHPVDIGPMKAALSAHISGQTPHFEHEYRMRHDDSSYRVMLCRGVAVRNAIGGVTRIAGSQTDITERAVVQEQLRHAALHDQQRRLDASIAKSFLDAGEKQEASVEDRQGLGVPRT